MSFLKKKTFFFMVLSIVCNPTFAADNPGASQNQSREEELVVCKANVHLVFPEDVTPFSEFKYALFMLSVKIIQDMTNTVVFANSLRQRAERLIYEHPDVLEFPKFKIYADQIGNRNVEITESSKNDISGYFGYLLTNYETFKDRIQLKIKMPARYCAEDHFLEVMRCRRALMYMLRRTEDNFNEMEAHQALRFCYLKYSYINFFDFNIFLTSSSSSSTYTPANDEERQLLAHQRRIMNAYFRHLTAEINIISIGLLHVDSSLFPTVEQYCADPDKNIT